MLKRSLSVRVYWEDIVDYAGQDWNDDYTEYPTASTSSDCRIAFDYKRGHTRLIISRDWDEDANLPKSVIAIPAGAVTSIVQMHSGLELWDKRAYRRMHTST